MLVIEEVVGIIIVLISIIGVADLIIEDCKSFRDLHIHYPLRSMYLYVVVVVGSLSLMISIIDNLIHLHRYRSFH